MDPQVAKELTNFRFWRHDNDSTFSYKDFFWQNFKVASSYKCIHLIHKNLCIDCIGFLRCYVCTCFYLSQFSYSTLITYHTNMTKCCYPHALDGLAQTINSKDKTTHLRFSMPSKSYTPGLGSWRFHETYLTTINMRIMIYYRASYKGGIGRSQILSYHTLYKF